MLDEPPLPGTQALLAKAFRKVGENVPAASAASNPIRRLLMSAGYRYPSAVPIFYGIKCALGLFFAVTFGVFGASNGSDISSALIAAVCGVGFGYLLPDFLLKPMIRARGKRIRRALPAALDLLILSVEAGQSLNQAIVDTGVELRQAHPELAAELAQAHLELRAGKRRAVDETLHAPVEMPGRREDRRDETDEQDLHRDERPGRAGDQDRLPVERRQPAVAEDLLEASRLLRARIPPSDHVERLLPHVADVRDVEQARLGQVANDVRPPVAEADDRDAQPPPLRRGAAFRQSHLRPSRSG